MPARDQGGAAVAHHDNSAVPILAGQLMGFHEQAFAALLRRAHKGLGIIAHRLMADQGLQGGVIKFPVIVKGLVGQPEAAVQHHPQQRIARARIGGEPGEGGTRNKPARAPDFQCHDAIPIGRQTSGRSATG